MKKIKFEEYNNGENIFEVFVGSNEEILAKREEILTHDYMGKIAYHIGEPKFTPNKKYCLVLEDNEIFGRLSLYGVTSEKNLIHNLLFPQLDWSPIYWTLKYFGIISGWQTTNKCSIIVFVRNEKA